MKRKHAILALAAGLLGGIGLYVGGRELLSRRGGGDRLAIRWEGLFIDRNSRDLGASLNACLGRPLFRTGVVHRANVWFSGWSCDEVGDPDVIYSLNHDQRREERYFCTRGDESVVGRFFARDDLVLHDLELERTWDDARLREVACAYFRHSYAEIGAGRRILVHCDAGKDRTGAYAALTAALAAELRGVMAPDVVQAIECDYRQSKSLEEHKYGRAQQLVERLASRGGVARFFMETCGIDRATLEQVARRVIAPAPGEPPAL